jgi:hypothetical protein
MKRELQMEISELTCRIQQIRNGNQVVIDRIYNQWGITIQDLIEERNELVKTYNKKFGKRFGGLCEIV